MAVFRSLVIVYSLLFRLQLVDGFSTIHPLSLGRPNSIELSSSFHRLSSIEAPVIKAIFAQRSLSSLRATETESEDSEETTGEEAAAVDDKALAMDDKIAGRKKRLTMGYKLASATYAASSIANIFGLGLGRVLSTSSLYYVLGGGPLNMAVILYILKGAASEDRLSSDTYKRLNIAVIAYALVQLMIPTGALDWIPRLTLKVPGFLALVNGIKGYGYGCLGWDKSKDTSTVIADMREGIQSTLKGLVTVKAKSVGYIFGTLLLGSLFCLKLKELCSAFVFASADTLGVTFDAASFQSFFIGLSKLARFGLMSTIMYTLKDASDRDRLSGTTFVQLNFLASAAFMSIAVYFFPTYGSMSSNSQLLAVGLLSVFTFVKGISNTKSKAA